MWDYGEAASVSVAEDFYDPDKPISDFGVLIPVAASQDADKIVPAMGEYARQEGTKPFTIFLSLNSPLDVSQDKIREAEQQVELAKQLFPWLDIRHTVMRYDTPIIGQIRKDLWDGAMRVALTDGIYDRVGGDLIGFNHDIDTESMSRHYMRNAQAFYRKKQAEFAATGRTETPLPPRYTQLKHAFPFATHPNIARTLFWSDLSLRQVIRGGVYSAGMAVPFSYYAKQRGFDKDAVIQEFESLLPRDNAGILGTSMETSPRRIVMRIGNGALSEIWTVDSFGPLDDCRNPLALPPDISSDDMELRIFESLDRDLKDFCDAGFRQWKRRLLYDMDYHAEMLDYDWQHLPLSARDMMDRRLNVARFALGRVIGSPLLVSMVDDSVLNRYADEFARETRELLGV